jgi:hypothetical protein
MTHPLQDHFRRVVDAAKGPAFVNKPQQFRLGSSPAIYAPGIVVWARSLALTDADKAAQIVSECWSIPLWAAQDLTLGRSAYRIEGETVIFPLD